MKNTIENTSAFIDEYEAYMLEKAEAFAAVHPVVNRGDRRKLSMAMKNRRKNEYLRLGFEEESAEKHARRSLGHGKSKDEKFWKRYASKKVRISDPESIYKGAEYKKLCFLEGMTPWY